MAFAIHQHESAMIHAYMCLLSLEPSSCVPPYNIPFGGHSALALGFCVIHQIPTGYLFYIW